MSQHKFNIDNAFFPATRADINLALKALASNSSGASEFTTMFANQFWFETDTNTLKFRNQANNTWIPLLVLDQSAADIAVIATQTLALGGTTLTSSGTEINQLDNITRGSILYGNASGATDRLAKGGAGTVLTSDGTDISWAAATGGATEFIASSGNISAADFPFTQFDASKYCNYQFVFLDVKPTTDNVSLEPQVSADAGSNYDTGSNYKLGSSATTSFSSAVGVGNASGDTGINGVFNVYNAGSDKFTMAKSDLVWTSASGDIASASSGVGHTVNEVTDAIRFKFSSGNIASGTILMYGTKKS